MRVYLDNAATTPVHPEVVKVMTDVLSNVHGNPSSIHDAGRKARTLVEESRKYVANMINSSIGEVFFTSSATEANNMILRMTVKNLGVERILVSSIEHPCVMRTVEELANEGIDVVYIPTNEVGRVDIDFLENNLKQSDVKTLVSVMYVNNELGVIQEIPRIAGLCKEYSAYFHTDAVQAIGKIKIDVQETPIHFLSASAHKFHGPKGIAFVYINNDSQIKSFITGGGQERNMRSGTENVSGIVGLSEALKHYTEVELKKIAVLKDRFKAGLKKGVPGISFVEDKAPELFVPSILSASFPSTPKSDLMTFNLDISGICASAGSACSSGVEKVSHVLSAINFPSERRAVRFSFSYMNTEEEIDYCIEKITNMFD